MSSLNLLVLLPGFIFIGWYISKIADVLQDINKSLALIAKVLVVCEETQKAPTVKKADEN